MECCTDVYSVRQCSISLYFTYLSAVFSWSYSKQAGYRMNGYARKVKKFSTDFYIAIRMYMAKHVVCNITKLLLCTNPIPNATWHKKIKLMCKKYYNLSHYRKLRLLGACAYYSK